jgi:hypothetical protein
VSIILKKECSINFKILILQTPLRSTQDPMNHPADNFNTGEEKRKEWKRKSGKGISTVN